MPARKSFNKSAFVRDLPLEMSVKDVVEKAKDAGFSLSETYVHTIRSMAKRKAAGVHVVQRAPESRSSNTSDATSRHAEALLRDLVIEHGVRTVQQMLDNVATKLRKLA
jgi:hypothetical protein